MSSLTTIAAIKSALDITTTAKDTLITTLEADASAWIETECARTFGSASYTELFSPGRDRRVQNNGARLVVKQYPIISVTSLHEDSDRVFDATALIAAADYWSDDYGVNLYADGDTVAFVPGERTVQLIYVAGYATIPSDLTRAAIMCAVHLFYKADRQKQNVASESLGGVTVSYLNEIMPKEARAIVDRYRRPFGM